MGDVTVSIAGVMEATATLSDHDTGAVIPAKAPPVAFSWTYQGLTSGRRYDFEVKYRGSGGGTAKLTVTGATTNDDLSYPIDAPSGTFERDDQTIVLTAS